VLSTADARGGVSSTAPVQTRIVPAPAAVGWDANEQKQYFRNIIMIVEHNMHRQKYFAHLMLYLLYLELLSLWIYICIIWENLGKGSRIFREGLWKEKEKESGDFGKMEDVNNLYLSLSSIPSILTQNVFCRYVA
jgi:hypothetical protein